jgi:hypothetical protein
VICVFQKSTNRGDSIRIIQVVVVCRLTFSESAMRRHYYLGRKGSLQPTQRDIDDAPRYVRLHSSQLTRSHSCDQLIGESCVEARPSRCFENGSRGPGYGLAEQRAHRERDWRAHRGGIDHRYVSLQTRCVWRKRNIEMYSFINLFEELQCQDISRGSMREDVVERKTGDWKRGLRSEVNGSNTRPKNQPLWHGYVLDFADYVFKIVVGPDIPLVAS